MEWDLGLVTTKILPRLTLPNPALPVGVVGYARLLAAAAVTIAVRDGILGVHVKAPTSCATLRAAPTAPGLSRSSKYTTDITLTTQGGNIPGTVWTSCAIGRMLCRYAD